MTETLHDTTPAAFQAPTELHDDELALPAEVLADDVEPDDDDDTDDDDDDTDQPEGPSSGAGPADSQAPAPLTPKELEARGRKLDAENARHARRIADLMGADFDVFVDCEACWPTTAGFHPRSDVFPEGTAEAMTYTMLAGGADALPVQPPHLHRCASCNGFGEWQTGSRKQSMTVFPCAECEGKGFIDERNTGTVTAPAAVSVMPERTADPPPAPVMTTDHIGRPYGHPNFGLLPIYATPEAKARDMQDGFGSWYQ